MLYSYLLSKNHFSVIINWWQGWARSSWMCQHGTDGRHHINIRHFYLFMPSRLLIGWYQPARRILINMNHFSLQIVLNFLLYCQIIIITQRQRIHKRGSSQQRQRWMDCWIKKSLYVFSVDEVLTSMASRTSQSEGNRPFRWTASIKPHASHQFTLKFLLAYSTPCMCEWVKQRGNPAQQRPITPILQ